MGHAVGPGGRPPLVLIVDDATDLRTLLAQWLAGNGWAVAQAADGRQALQHVGQRRPDVLLLDLGLPDLSGAQVVTRLRAEPATASLPIVLLTGGREPARLPPDGTYHSCLLKPCDAQRIDQALRAAMAAPPGRPFTPSPTAPAGDRAAP